MSKLPKLISLECKLIATWEFSKENLLPIFKCFNFCGNLISFQILKASDNNNKSLQLIQRKVEKVSVIIIIKLQHNEGQLRRVKSPKKFLRCQNSAPLIFIVLRELHKPNAIFIRPKFFLDQCEMSKISEKCGEI